MASIQVYKPASSQSSNQSSKRAYPTFEKVLKNRYTEHKLTNNDKGEEFFFVRSDTFYRAFFLDHLGKGLYSVIPNTKINRQKDGSIEITKGISKTISDEFKVFKINGNIPKFLFQDVLPDDVIKSISEFLPSHALPSSFLKQTRGSHSGEGAAATGGRPKRKSKRKSKRFFSKKKHY